MFAATKAGAVLAALSTSWHVQLVLIWHLGLLKLLPFFRMPNARVAVCLLGIEAWRPQDWLTQRLLPRVNLFFSISDHTWRRFLAWNPMCEGAAHQTVYLGIGSPVTHATPPPIATAALMLGRLARREDYKGHREMIDAWPQMLRRMPEAELWIAGGGDLREDLERLTVKRGIRHRVRFWGAVSETEKEDLLVRSRCLTLPSRGEGFGLVYLEAMRLGRPCLVSNVDAGREVVNPPEAGLAADPSDPDALVDALCRLMSPGADWEMWSRQGRQRYEREFTAAHFQRRLLAALDSVPR